MSGRRRTSPPDNIELAQALMLFLQSGATSAASTSDQPPPNWVEEILKALEPLKSLAPTHGEIPPQDAKRLAQLQSALRRADFSRAERPADNDCRYRTLTCFIVGGQS